MVGNIKVLRTWRGTLSKVEESQRSLAKLHVQQPTSFAYPQAHISVKQKAPTV